jgi:hypothetical protein
MQEISEHTRDTASAVQRGLEGLPLVAVVVTAAAIFVMAAIAVGMLLVASPDPIMSAPIRL